MTPDLPPPIDPAPPTAPGPRPAGQGLVEWVRASRPAAAYLFLGLSALFLAATVFLALRSTRAAPAADPPAAADPLDPDAKPPAVDDPKKGDYTTGWVATAYGLLVTGAVGAYLLLSPPRVDPAAARTEARVVILAAGGLLGAGLILFAGVFFYRWSDSPADWLEKGQAKARLFAVLPLVMAVAGAGLVFLAVQPARAEERDNPLLRRLVYGANLGLTAFLLLLVLVVANVAVARKVPNRLDTTESGFYTLADSTKAFLAKLGEPATLYVILPDLGDRGTNDIRQFAYEAQDAGGGRLKARFVSPVTNKQELARLHEKYPRIGRDDEGILVTVGEDERRNAFIPYNDLFDTEGGGFGRRARVKGFAGEGRVMKELEFLAGNEVRPVVYFTQGNGEPGVTPGGDDLAGGPTANRLREYLEKSYVAVKPLAFPARDPAVPDDAAAVVVLDPQAPLPAPAAGALRKYMTERKGKLVVAAGAAPGPAAAGVARTGLEDLLREFNVRLGDKFVYAAPTSDLPEYRRVLAILNPGLQNPITQAFGGEVQAYLLTYPREAAPLAAAPNLQAAPLVVTAPGRFTWLDDARLGPDEVNQLLPDLQENEQLQARKALSRAARPVGVVVSEGGTGRAVVFGFGAAFTDRAAERARGGGVPAEFDLLAVSLDWLRDRPAVGLSVAAKPYQEYQFPEPAAVDTTRLVWFPLGLGLLVVVGFGAGVWVIRRK